MERSLEDDIQEILYSRVQISERAGELGSAIAEYYSHPEKDLVLVNVLKGGTIFLADLMRAVDLPLSVDFMAISAYGPSSEEIGVVRILKDLEESIAGRDVLIVEDIIDTGLTCNYLRQSLESRGPASLEICTLLDKTVRRIVDMPIRFSGFDVPDVFVVGYGLDYLQRYRNLPYIGVLKPEVYFG
ncbi:MAG: hypoxanthine phosphoribosyltransferase [Actinobacteria bacterium]|nr:MAG: hypoxanthine phosphoribosyltransferase [Actinomycetota bacterium]